MNRWDSKYYIDIAKHGYSYHPGALNNVAFFPLYPLVLKVLMVLPIPLYVLAWLFNLACLVVAGIFLYRLVEEFHAKNKGYIAVIFMLILPTAFFYQLIYTEALFLALSVTAVYMLRRQRWDWFGLLAFLAALTRSSGFILVIPALVEAWKLGGIKYVTRPRVIGALFAPVAGLVAFYGYLQIRFGSYRVFFDTQSTWGRRTFVLNRDHFILHTSPAIVNFALDATVSVLALAACFYIWKKLRPSYALYCLAAIILPLSTGTLMSVGRYILPLFPIPILLATVKKPAYQLALGFVLTLGFALSTILIANAYWAG